MASNVTHADVNNLEEAFKEIIEALHCAVDNQDNNEKFYKILGDVKVSFLKVSEKFGNLERRGVQ
jgi:hypothetical protein